jgi:hypothetical protein
MCGLVLLASPETTQAQIRPVYTKNLDEKGRAPYQIEQLFIVSSCTFNGILYFCDHTMPAVPAGKRLVIEHITMFAALAGGVPDSVRFMHPVFFSTVFWIQPTFTTRAISGTHFFLDRPTNVYYEAGQTPILRLQTTGQPQSVEFTIHGYLIDAVN